MPASVSVTMRFVRNSICRIFLRISRGIMATRNDWNVVHRQFSSGVIGPHRGGKHPRVDLPSARCDTLHREIQSRPGLHRAKDSIRSLCGQAKEVAFYGLTPPIRTKLWVDPF